MDIKVVKRPFPRGGVSWSTANRWIVGTSAQVLIVTPQFTVAGRIPTKREVIAAIEPTQNIEAVGLLDGLPGSFPYADAMVVLASDSTIRVFASSQNPDSANWKEVGRGGFGTGAEHICAIASTTLAGADGTDELPVVACGSMGGRVSVVGLGGYSDGRIEASRVLTFDAHASAISYLVWLHDSVTGEGAHRHILAVCAADGVVQLWGVAPDLSEAALVMVACERDWRPVTAHGVGTDCCVLAKQGLAMVIDARDARSIAIHRVALGGSQTLVACAVDDGRGRIYIGSYDFVIAVLARRGDEWCREAEEEAPLRDGMRKTVVQSFTTKFNMQRLFLRGLALSPQGRYLGFAVDDQVNWDMVIDGAAITRIHFHQLGGWTTDDAKRALERVLDGKCPGALRYSLWDIVNGESTATIGTIVDHLRGMDLAPGSAMHRQRLHILNVLSCALEGDQSRTLAAEARNHALGDHVKALFAFIDTEQGAGHLFDSDDDRAYLARLRWAVSQPAYSDIAEQLPSVTAGSHAATSLSCPICQEEMELRSRQMACCLRNHIFDVCSVTLEILESPGSDQCSMCMTKRKHASDGRPAGLVGRVLARFPQCPFCRGRFYRTAA